MVDFGLVKELKTDRAALTHGGAVTGTPLYLAPEAIRVPDQIEARAGLGPDLAALVMECQAKDPAARPQSAKQVLERLQSCAWSAREARTWWKEHGAELRGRRTPPVSGRSTIAVDLQRR